MSQENTHVTQWVCITQVENIPLREGRAVQIAGHVIAVFNLGDRFLAVENKCPHRGGPLADGIVSGSAVVCPLHAWKVDLLSGEVLNRQDAQCVRTFPIRVDSGIVSIEVAVESATAQGTPNCLAQVSQGQFPNGTASSEV